MNPDTEEDAMKQAETSGQPTESPEGSGDRNSNAEKNSADDPVEPEKTPEQEAAEWRELALRRQADLENFRKRIERDRMDSIRYANKALLEELLPVIDNFEMGLEAARTESTDSMIFKGMEMVKKQLADFLESRGVVEVETGNHEFNPAIHEAMGQEESAEVADGHIVRTIRRGYILNDRLLRAASVIVATSAGGAGKESARSALEAESGDSPITEAR